MSKGPFGAETETRFKKREFYHLKLENKDWCTYFKECPIENNITGEYCWVCKYCSRDLDVPHLLAERGKN